LKGRPARTDHYAISAFVDLDEVENDLRKPAKAIEAVSEMAGHVLQRGGMMKLISHDEQIREIEFMELQIEFANNERLWRRKSDYKAAQRASAAEEKLVKMFMDGWTDRETMAKAYNQYRLRLLYKHRTEA
jgi:hypothetical protein